MEVDLLAEPTRSLTHAARSMVAEFLTSERGQALARVGASYRALTGAALPLAEMFESAAGSAGMSPPPVSAVAAVQTPAGHESVVAPDRPSTARRSVRERVHDLLAETRRPMSYAEIITTYESRNDPIVASDVKNAIRTAASNLVAENLVVRVEDGIFQIAELGGG